VIQESYNKIRTWYDCYVSEFSSEDQEIQINIELKKEHAYRVVEIVNELAVNISLDESDLLLIETAALLHDVGRFEQLVQTGTYTDSDDLNHIQLGLDVIEQHDVLKILDEGEKNLVIDCVKMHDLSVLPKSIDKRVLALAHLLRDADRIDVLRIVSDYYTHKKLQPNKHLDMELKDMPAIAKKICDAILAERVAKREDVETVNDLKLMQMSWIFEMKYKMSFKIVSEKGYIKAIFETLPKTDLVIDMYRNMKIFMENQL